MKVETREDITHYERERKYGTQPHEEEGVILLLVDCVCAILSFQGIMLKSHAPHSQFLQFCTHKQNKGRRRNTTGTNTATTQVTKSVIG
jgi:hypothetical protein